MHGFSSGSTCLVNAEVDSMGGGVDGGVGIDTKPSPRRFAIEKAQAELRVEYDVREERRRELEFLEKGGNPLDLEFGHAKSVSVQSTSRTDQEPDQILTSEAKGSFALTTSPYGDSVESSGRLGVTIAREPNSADNFDGDSELLESERKSTHHGGGSITPSEHSSQLDRSQNVKESEDSPIFHPKKGQAYMRRNRSRSSRDGPRSNLIDVVSRVGHGSCLPDRHAVLSKPVMAEIPEKKSEMQSDGMHALHQSTTSTANDFLEAKQGTPTSKDKQEEPQDEGVKTEQISVATSSLDPDLAAGLENVVSVGDECHPCSDAEEKKNNAISVELKESSKMNGDGKCVPTEGTLCNTVQTTKGLDSESSCTETSLSVVVNGNIDSQLCLKLRNIDSNWALKEHKQSPGEKEFSKDENMLNDNHVRGDIESSSCDKEDRNVITQEGNGFAAKDPEEVGGRSSTGHNAKCSTDFRCQDAKNHSEMKSEGLTVAIGDSILKMASSSPVKLPSSVDPSCHKPNKTDISASPAVSQPQIYAEDQPKVVSEVEEDRILEEARIIKAKRKRIAELSGGLLTREYRQRSHWDFVVEEMAWLANDFAQERLWKMTAAAQVCQQVAFASRLRLEEQNKYCKQKAVAHTLAKAVMDFWNSIGLVVQSVDTSQSENWSHDAKADEVEVAGLRAGGSDKDNCSEQKFRKQKQDLAVNRYTLRFLQFNCSSTPFLKAEASESPVSTIDIPEISWQNKPTEENLFYLVSPGAMDTYRRSIELCLIESQRMTNNWQEEVDTSMNNAPAEFGYEGNYYEEEEGENMYYLPGAFGTGKPSKKKQKNMKFYANRSYDSAADFGYGQCMDRNGALRSTLVGKRPSNSLHVGLVPTKRMRTASRQRVVGFFNSGSAMVASAANRLDACSGDTNSFQDDQSSMHGGSTIPRSSEVDSAAEFEKQYPFDSTEMFVKPKKKKKKNKHQGAAYEPKWPLDSAVQNEQKDTLRKRVDGYQLESNGHGLFVQHAKKLKVMKQSLDSSFDNTMPMSGSVASPVNPQMSFMSNQSKIIKLIGSRDRSRKAKALKVPVGQPDSGSPWTLFEDQALVVLVHDMGPNWELVSDAMNNTLQFKCIFRKPQECKERHKILMDRTSGDGADSADDSGSSQPYPSTLPGIPKGSARQLFQHLQGPMEEDTIKCHFEKIILIRQQLHCHKKQNDVQDLKQMTVHESHVIAISQVFPNNLNGITLSPLELCDAAASNEDVLPLGGQALHPGGLPLSGQTTVPRMQSPRGVNSPLRGSTGVGVANNLASPSSQFNSPRYSVPRSASLPMDEQQRLQQYNQMLHGRNIQPLSVTSGADRGARVIPGGNGAAMISGTNRSMAMPRPGMLNSGSMLAPSMGGIPSNSNMPAGSASGQGNAKFRPRDALHKVRPGQSTERQRQMAMPEMQMQGSQSNSQGGVPPFGGMSPGITNQTPTVQAYPGHHRQNHPIQQHHSHVIGGLNHPHLPSSNHLATPEQQALLRLARERQIQQGLLQRQQQILSPSALATHAQTPTHLPISSYLHSSSQLQPKTSSQPVSLPPLSPSSPVTHVSSSQPQQQLNHQVPPQGPVRTGQSGMMTGKQRQRQAQQQSLQSGRQHPQQRPQSQQPQQQAKVLKGIGKSTTVMHQSLPIDPSHLNGLSSDSGAEAPEKGEQVGHLMPSQGVCPVPGSNTMQSPKALAASPQNSGHLQPAKPYANTIATASKQVQHSPQLDGNNQDSITVVPSVSEAPASGQGVSPAVIASVKHEHMKGMSQPLKAVNQSHLTHKMPIQRSHLVNSDHLTKVQAEQLSSANGNVRMASESLCEPATPSSPASSGPICSPGITDSSGNEPLGSVNQGLGQRQLSAKLTTQGNSVGAQWPQQQSQPQQLHSLQPLSQKEAQHQLQPLEQSPQRVPQ